MIYVIKRRVSHPHLSPFLEALPQLLVTPVWGKNLLTHLIFYINHHLYSKHKGITSRSI